MDMPTPKNWKHLLEQDLEKSGNKKEDILRILNLCDGYIKEIQDMAKWYTIHLQFVEGVKQAFQNQYNIRFTESPTQPERLEVNESIILDSPPARTQKVRQVALEITKIGSKIDCESIIKELERRNIKLIGSNPNAIIGTIMNGFKSNFQKGKRGEFLRIN